MRVETSGLLITLSRPVSTVGRGPGVDVTLPDLSVSRLHAELVRRGPHLYVCDLGLSANGTRVNARPVGRRLLANGDVISFGLARVQVEGLPGDTQGRDTAQDRDTAGGGSGGVGPEALTLRELEVLTALCRPHTHDAFGAPATVAGIAAELHVTDAGVKAHLLRLYAKFDIPIGVDRRSRLANKVIRAGLVPPPRPAGRGADSSPAGRRSDPPPGAPTRPLPTAAPSP